MPLTITYTEGVLPKGCEQQVVKQMTDSMLKWHGLSGNKVMTPNITASVHTIPKSSSFSGGEEVDAVWVEWRTPSFAFDSREVQKGFFKDATDIIDDLAGGTIPRNNIYVNVVHTVDGAWNFEGEAMSNEEIGQAIS